MTANLANIDFRENSLTGTGGFDSLGGTNSGSITVTETDPGVGIYAADWASITEAYGIRTLPAAEDEVFAWIYFILDATPGSGIRLFTIQNGGTQVGVVDLATDRKLYLSNNGGGTIGSASSALTVGTLYRIGLRQKKGTGSDGELEAYLAEGHAALSSFAASTTETFTTQATAIWAGTTGANALDGRIGMLRADSRAFPASYLEVHDFLVDNLGFMRLPGGAYQVADIAPPHDRAAIGEARHDTFATPSFFAQANTGGGAGQSRMMASDKFLTGIADTRFDGYIFPPRAKKDESGTAGAAGWYFNRGTTLYGVTASNFETIGTSTTNAHGGFPKHAPVVDGQNNAWWATTSDTLRFWDGSTFSDKTPTLATRVNHVAAYGRHIWAICERDVPTKGLQSEKTSGASAGTSQTWTSTEPTEAVDTLSVVAVYVDADSASDAASLDIDAASSVNWNLLGTIAIDDGASTYLQCNIYYQWGGGPNAATITTTKDDYFDDWIVHWFHLEGLTYNQSLTLESDTDAGTGTTLTHTVAAGADFQVAGVMSSTAGDTIGEPTGWTSTGDLNATTFTATHAYENQSDTSIDWDSMTSAAYKLAWNISMQEDTAAGTTQVTILATANEGNTWAEAPANFGPDFFGTIRASLPFAQALWITTDRGLFRMVGQVNETLGGEEIADVGLTQEDEWELPPDDNAGKWLTSYQGLLYFPVGATIRRFAPNSSDLRDDRVFWPPPEWSTIADQVQAVVGNEAGIWFGSGGYLWCFNGRGFHQMAAEPSANDYDYMFWHQGKLYINTDPADYYLYHYPSVRPDILIDQGDLAAADFTTGYFITSSIDFEKVADPKIIRTFESQVSFTGGDANSGSVDLHYREGCGTSADPGVGSGGDTGSSWTSIGDHDNADGGYKRHNLATPLQCVRIYERLTLNTGSSGIPVVHFFTIQARTKMPSIKGIVDQAQVNVGMRDRDNNELVSSYDEAKKWLRVVKALRSRIALSETLYHTVTINDGTDGGDEYLTTFAQLQESITEDHPNQNRTTIQMTMNFEEIPS